MGMAFAILGLGVLSGGPGSGAVLQHNADHLDWTATWIYGGGCAIASGIAFCTLRVILGDLKLRRV